MKGDKKIDKKPVDRKAVEFDQHDEQKVRHEIQKLVADKTYSKKLLKASHEERVAVLEKNGYKFKK